MILYRRPGAGLASRWGLLFSWETTRSNTMSLVPRCREGDTVIQVDGLEHFRICVL